MNLIPYLDTLKNYIWSAPLLILLAGVAAYLTLLLRGIQFRQLGYGLRLAFTPGVNADERGDISHFQALMTSLAGAIGTGNIAGVATAVALGGLGSVFWMWVIALLGMATKYAESHLAVKYRITDLWGEMAGGPMYYIERGLGWRWMARAFALFASVAAIGTGNMVQANSVSDAVRELYPIEPWMIGVCLAVVTGVVLIGGVKSIGKVAGVLVPVMASCYLFGGLVILGAHWEQIPGALALIVESAFTGQSAVGGFAGSTMAMAIQMGISRGVFSNESGLGISSIAAAAAKTDNPSRQALVAMTGTFISTLVVCSITALVIAVTGVLGQVDAQGNMVNGAPMVMRAFDSTISGGSVVVTFGLILFAYSTIVGWAYYGEKCCEYLLGTRSIIPYRIIYTLLIIPGSVLQLEAVWGIADVSNGLMVLPNLVALLLLGRSVAKDTRRFFLQEADGA